MTNLSLQNKKTQYTAKSEGTNVRIEGQVSVDDTQKVTDFNGTVYALGEQPAYLGSFSYNANNASVNLQQSKELISEVSKLIIDTIAGVETQLTAV